MKKILIVAPTYNEEEIIQDFINEIFNNLSYLKKKYIIDVLIIDNDSSDSTQEIIKIECKRNKNLKAIFNNQNYGHIRSPYYGLLQGINYDATILMASDFQDPINLLPEFIKDWEMGFKASIGIKKNYKEDKFKFFREIFYNIISSMSEFRSYKNYTGFGIYDLTIIKELTKIKDPYPFLRYQIAEIGVKAKTTIFDQPKRKKGKSKNNFFILLDMAILGVVSSSLVPLRILTLIGSMIFFTNFIIAFTFLIKKIINWNNYDISNAVIWILNLSALGFLVLGFGILGEYLAYHIKLIKNKKLVYEKERINF